MQDYINVKRTLVGVVQMRRGDVSASECENGNLSDLENSPINIKLLEVR